MNIEEDSVLIYDGRFNGFDIWLDVEERLNTTRHISNPAIEKMQWNTPWEKITDMDRFWDRYMDKYNAEEEKAKRQWVRSIQSAS